MRTSLPCNFCMVSLSSLTLHNVVGLVFSVSKSTSCSTRIRAFALIPFMEYDVVFPSIFVSSFTLIFKEDGSSISTHFLPFCRDYFIRSRVFSSDSSLLSACVTKNSSPSATSEEEMVTSIGVVWISSRILRRIISVTLSSSLEKKSALTQPATCGILKKMQRMFTCIPECWRNCLCLEKMCDGFVVCQENCWLC